MDETPTAEIDRNVRIEDYTDDGVIVSFRATAIVPWEEIDLEDAIRRHCAATDSSQEGD